MIRTSSHSLTDKIEITPIHSLQRWEASSLIIIKGTIYINIFLYILNYLYKRRMVKIYSTLFIKNILKKD